MYLGAIAPHQSTIGDIADELQISKNHLMKIVNNLANAEVIIATRGKNGGVSLNKDALELTVAEIVEHVEPSLAVVECLSTQPCKCIFVGACGLTGLFAEAKQKFIEHLQTKTLAEIIDQNHSAGVRFSA